MLPPKFRSVKKLASIVIRLDNLIGEKTYKALEVHPTLTRKARKYHQKWEGNSRFPEKLGLKVDIETVSLAEHEIKAVTVILTTVLHLQGQTELISNDKEDILSFQRKETGKP